jgi:hypothetical protein
MQIPFNLPNFVVVLEAREHLLDLGFEIVSGRVCDHINHVFDLYDLRLAPRNHASEDTFGIEVKSLELSIGFDSAESIEEQW